MADDLLWLRDLRTTPPDGWFYLHEVTGFKIVASGWKELYQRVVQYKHANNYPVGSNIELEIQDQICRRIPDDWCASGSRGWGDIAHFVFNPIAQAIDAVAGTDIANCNGCSRRRNQMNRRQKK